MSENKTIGTGRVVPIEYCKHCDSFTVPFIYKTSINSSDCLSITYNVNKYCGNGNCKIWLGTGLLKEVRAEEAHNYTWKSLSCNGRSHNYAFTCTKCNVQERSLTVSCNGNCVLPMKVE